MVCVFPCFTDVVMVVLHPFMRHHVTGCQDLVPDRGAHHAEDQCLRRTSQIAAPCF
uniref:Uncharacterized protein n=1 Tax=Anguilla anguilla TaxID=7936 RepID=A0A0E9TKF7_ANGAN